MHAIRDQSLLRRPGGRSDKKEKINRLQTTILRHFKPDSYWCSYEFTISTVLTIVVCVASVFIFSRTFLFDSYEVLAMHRRSESEPISRCRAHWLGVGRRPQGGRGLRLPPGPPCNGGHLFVISYLCSTSKNMRLHTRSRNESFVTDYETKASKNVWTSCFRSNAIANVFGKEDTVERMNFTMKWDVIFLAPRRVSLLSCKWAW